MKSSLFVCAVVLKRSVAVLRVLGVKWGLKRGGKATESIHAQLKSTGSPAGGGWTCLVLSPLPSEVCACSCEECTFSD